MDELFRSWLRRYFTDPIGSLSIIEEELRAFPPETARQFHTEKELLHEYFYRVLTDGDCPSEIWLSLHPGLSRAVEAIVKQIERMVKENRRAAWIGRKIGPYRLLYRIGAGGMAEVYAVEKTDIEVKRRALKLLRLSDQCLDMPASMRQKLREELAARLRQEADNLEKINHPRVVRYFDVDLDPESGEPYVVTELIEGFSLERLLWKGGALPAEEAVAVVMEICAGLKEVHKKELIHRDLTLANVLIDWEGNVKIIDFGLSQSMLPSGTGFRTGADRFHWRTLRYASPEQLRREPATEKSDLYMLGKQLYVLLLYRPEWEAEDQWPVPTKLEHPAWNNLAPRFAPFILKATAAAPEARFSDASKMLEALRQFGGSEVPLRECIARVRELQEENDPFVNLRIGNELATRAIPPILSPDDGELDQGKQPKRQKAQVLLASGLVLCLLLAAAPVFLKMAGDTRPTKKSQEVVAPQSQPASFKGECFWRLWSRSGASVPAGGLPLGDLEFGYLKGGDRVALEFELKEGPEAYFYVLQVDVEGVARLLYPAKWTWKELPQQGKKRKHLHLPEKGGDAPLADSATGLESLLWLVREQPLTAEANVALQKLLTPPELQWEQTTKMVQMMEEDPDAIMRPIWMENGVFRDTRGQLLLDQASIGKDPVRQTERICLAIREQQLASYTRAVCYPFLSREKGKRK